MGIMSGLMGNSSPSDKEEAVKKLTNVLFEGESVEHAYKLIRDMIVFTNSRLILVDIQGMTGTKVDYHSIPYRSITHFKTETAGSFDMDAELKIFLSGSELPIEKTFKRGNSILDVQKLLAYYVSR